jgi:hypothetical protein
MNINKIFFGLVQEQNILKTTKVKPIADAIVNRNPITFYYSGPRKPKKKSVKAGTRVKAEAVALGVQKQSGSLIIRAYVQPPSVSKKGFSEHGWRTFRIDRMSNIQIISDETFDTKKPLYKEGNDGSMNPTYVSSLWTDKPEVKSKEPVKPEPITKEPKPIDTVKEPEKTLPQPKPDEKPSKTPEVISTTKHDVDVYDLLKSKINDVEGNKTIKTIDYESSLKDLYKRKENEWIENQKKVGGNTSPGEGTRNRFKKESKFELDNLLSKDNVTVSNEENNQLQETITRIKTLIFF